MIINIKQLELENKLKYLANRTKEEVIFDKINKEKQWRDLELKETDYIVAVTDHPNYSEYITYRQELRDYPAQQDFPNGERPIKP